MATAKRSIYLVRHKLPLSARITLFVMEADFCGNLANGEPMSHGGQILSKAEAELSGDNEAL